MRVTSTNLRLGTGWKNSSSPSLPRTFVEIHLEPGETPTALQFVEEAAGVLERELLLPTRDQDLGQAVLEAIGLMQAADAIERNQRGLRCSDQEARGVLMRLLPLAEKCATRATGEARSDASMFLEGLVELLALSSNRHDS